jgi:ABC-type glycerol-3-phosphate transport system permease component
MRLPIAKLLIYLLLSAFGLAFFLPFYWMVISSFKRNVFDGQLIPREPTLSNYRAALFDTPFLSWFINSLVVCAIVTVAQVLTGSLAGYAFAKKRFIGSRPLFSFLLSLMMVPFPAVILAQYWIVQRLGETGLPIGLNSWMGMAWPGLASVFAVFMMRQYFSAIPDDLIRAARVDGCSEWQVIWRIVMPAAKPAILTLALFTFQFHWGNYLWQFMVAQTPDMYTLPVGQAYYQFMPNPPLGVLMAMATLSILPLLAAFLFMQQYFIRGALAGAVTG